MTEIQALREALRLLEETRDRPLEEGIAVLDRVAALLEIAKNAIGQAADGARMLAEERGLCVACGEPTRLCACPDCGLTCAVPHSSRCRAVQ